jgi:hypothetical protein
MTKARGTRLSPIEKAQILEKLRSGARPKVIAAEFKVSLPTIYNLRKEQSPKRGTVSAVSVLQAEVAAAEARIAELEKATAEIQKLRQEVEVKNTVIDSLLKLETES